MRARELSEPGTRLFGFVLACLCACALLALPATAGAAQHGVVLPNPNLDNGTLERIQASGARHVRVFASWRMLEQQRGQVTPYILSGYDELANRLRPMGIGLYLVVTQTPAWATASGAPNAPPPVGLYADFMRRLAGHFKGRVMGYEVWNEPDSNGFWAGGTPGAYTSVLKEAHAAVKGADPAAKVGVGGLVGNHHAFVDGMYASGAKGHFDFVGVHTDNACSRNDPTQAVRDVDGRISRWSFTGYREVRATMLRNGDDKPIWMTELGWMVTSAKCPVNADPWGVTAATQASYLTKAYACLAADPYMEVSSWFSLSDFGPTNAEGAGFGLWAWNGTPRPSLAAFQHVGNVAPDRSCGMRTDQGAPGIDVAYPTDGRNVSANLRFKAVARDDQGVRTLAVLVDGKQIKITGSNTLTGRWTGWRRLPYGPHTVTFKAVDNALNVSTRNVTVNRVPYGDGEPVGTRIAVGLYGRGNSRIAAGTLFTRPGEAKRFLRGRMTIVFERKAGRRWRPVGSVAAGRVASAIQRRRTFRPGKYRVVMSFPGYKSFKPAVARRGFTVS